MAKENEAAYMPEGMFTLGEMPKDPREDEQVTPKTPDGMTREELLEALRATQDENERRWEKLLKGSQPKLVEPQAPSFALDLDGLPDPAQDLNGYHKGLAERLGKLQGSMAEHYSREANQIVDRKVSSSDLLNTAWAHMKDKHADIAQHEDLVKASLSGYVSELQSQGSNLIDALAQDMQGTVAEIAKRAKGTIDKIRGLEQDDKEVTGRTAVVSGNGPAPKRSKATDEKVVDFSTQLKSAQKAMGIF